ncbi:MAG: hypothetical protein E6G39_12535 [Actinobacteria bacterium]|nr:MAG: hypothetical protein E6G39_12535 [Actinomycetota bacterium]
MESLVRPRAGVMLGRRYVATPELHDLRHVLPESGFAARRGTFVTIYTLCEPPESVFATMTTLRDKLYGENRMNFPADKKMVREGDVFRSSWAVSCPAIMLPPEDVPFVGHTGIVCIQRQGNDEVRRWYRDTWAPRVVNLHGVHGVSSLSSHNRDGLDMDLVYVEGDVGVATQLVRTSVGHHPDARIVLDAPFDLIQPLIYPFAAAIRASDLPKTVA